MAEIKIKGYISSDLQTADAAIKASAGTLGGMILLSDTSTPADVTLTLYDDPDSAEGTELAKHILDVSVAGLSVFVPLDDIPFSTGCYADVAGAGGNYIVFYR